MKPRLIKYLLATVAVLGVTAQLVDPVGDALKQQSFLGGSFAAFVALVLFDAISGSEQQQQDIPGVHVLSDVEDLREPVQEAFEAPDVRIDFSGYTMETLLTALRPNLRRLGESKATTRSLNLRVIVVHLDAPMNLPGALHPALNADGTDGGMLTFSDSPENRERMRVEFTERNRTELGRLLERARLKNPHMAINCEIRESPHSPTSKLYIFNDEKVYYGAYGIKENVFERQGVQHRILDTGGFRIRHGSAKLIGWDKRSPAESTRMIADYHSAWFENLWGILEHVVPATPRPR